MAMPKIEMKGTDLVITIDCSQKAKDEAGPSKGGKTRLLASTNGFTNYNGVGVSLNATLPLK